MFWWGVWRGQLYFSLIESGREKGVEEEIGEGMN